MGFPRQIGQNIRRNDKPKHSGWSGKFQAIQLWRDTRLLWEDTSPASILRANGASTDAEQLISKLKRASQRRKEATSDTSYLSERHRVRRTSSRWDPQSGFKQFAHQISLSSGLIASCGLRRKRSPSPASVGVATATPHLFDATLVFASLATALRFLSPRGRWRNGHQCSIQEPPFQIMRDTSAKLAISCNGPSSRTQMQ